MSFLNRKYITRSVALLVFASGVLNITSAIWSFAPHRLRFLETLLPIEVANFSRTLTLLIGFFLLYLARSLWFRKYRAWLLSVGLIVLSLILHLTKGLDVEESVTLLVPLGALVLFRNEFVVQSGRLEFFTGARNALLILATLFIYAVLGFYILNGQFSHPVNFNTIRRDYEYSILGIGHDTLIPKTRQARWFEDSLSVVGFVAVLLTISSVFAPSVLKDEPTDEERSTAQKLVLAHSENSTDYLTLMDDKQYFFSPTKLSYIAYKIRRGVAVVLGGPIGVDIEKQSLVETFSASMSLRGLTPVFYNSTEQQKKFTELIGMKSLKIGEEAIISTMTFSLDGAHMKDVRNAVSRMEREGISYEWHPLDQVPWHIIIQVDQLHGQWLSKKKAPPLTFSVDFYPFPPEQHAWLLVVRSREGKLFGVLSFFPYQKNTGLVLESMLRAQHAPNGMVEAAIVDSIRFAKEHEISNLSLGVAPLANVNAQESTGLINKSTQFVFRNINQIYRYQPLFEFKQKFSPTWQPKYLSYKSDTQLPAIALALLQVHTKENVFLSIFKKLLS